MKEKEFQHMHDQNAFLADIIFALNEDLLTTEDIGNIMKLISKRIYEKQGEVVIRNVKIPVEVTEEVDSI